MWPALGSKGTLDRGARRAGPLRTLRVSFGARLPEEPVPGLLEELGELEEQLACPRSRLLGRSELALFRRSRASRA
jgi:hypothetical protein